jgi:hypothetical protein
LAMTSATPRLSLHDAVRSSGLTRGWLIIARLDFLTLG